MLNYALANYYSAGPSKLESGVECLLQELFVQPISALKTVVPAVFGFFGGTLLLLTWHFLKTRMVRFLLACDGWFLHPKRPTVKVVYAVINSPASQTAFCETCSWLARLHLISDMQLRINQKFLFSLRKVNTGLRLFQYTYYSYIVLYTEPIAVPNFIMFLVQLWYLLMIAIMGRKMKKTGEYQDYLPSLPVPSLKATCRKYDPVLFCFSIEYHTVCTILATSCTIVVVDPTKS